MMTDDYLKEAHLPGLGSLRELELLETLSQSSIALRGTHDDDVFEPDGFRDDDEDGEKHTLDGLLPPFLKQLHVLCEDLRLEEDDLPMLEDPRAAQLENLTIMTCMKDHWISTLDGEGRERPRTTPIGTAGPGLAERPRPNQAVTRPPPTDLEVGLGYRDYMCMTNPTRMKMTKASMKPRWHRQRS
ncbi:hypothetical protein Slin14017_G074370 [Septoria linicola]|nr:hypothetical protein Slin14017_G074370 [Septoria linicola]